MVSTHSRPKAAAWRCRCQLVSPRVSTHSRPKAAASQTRAGGEMAGGFNTQPPEGGCSRIYHPKKAQHVSTHSRPKAAATSNGIVNSALSGFNTQPPEGGCNIADHFTLALDRVSTHSRPKAAAIEHYRDDDLEYMFQHTAARRRLRPRAAPIQEHFAVSTHSRPKAAARQSTYR